MGNDKSIHLILSIGLDRNALISRNRLLRSRGHLVLESVNVEDGFQLFASMDLDLAILCDSIRHVQQAELARSMKAHRPLTPILAVVRGLTRLEHADISLNNLFGPEALLECVGSLLKDPVSALENCKGMRGATWQAQKIQ